MIHRYFLSTAILILFNAACFNLDGQGIGNGSDGSPSISGIINRYTPLLQSASGCSLKIVVGDATLFNAGDLVLIIQMQGAQIDATNTSSYGSITDYNLAGNYEFAKVKSIIGTNTIEFQYPLTRSYDANGNVQVIRVPQYVSPLVTGMLTCQPWNGSTGGVLAIDAADTIVLHAAMDVSAKGFRGGEVITGPDYITDTLYISETPSLFADAPKGEGIAAYGIAPYTSGRGAPANGGGGGNSHTGGGAGGANYGCGGNGGWSYPLTSYYKDAQGLGGHALNYSSALNKLFMGGGGGAGSSHAGQGTSGGNGGGIIIITGNKIVSNGNALNAAGDSSLSGGGPTHADGIGGAGAGGTIVLAIDSSSDTLHVNVYGGNGGSPSLLGAGPGGGGGGGLCWLNNAFPVSNISLDTAGGIGGNALGNNYGAANGCAGGLLNDITIPFNLNISQVKADFATASSNPLGTSIVMTNNSSHAVFYHWDFGDGATDSTLNPQHNYSSPGIYSITLIASDAIECADTTSQEVITNMTNVFTPNDDGINDFFYFPNFDVQKYTVRFLIYDRWGIKIFSGDDINNKWDGTMNGKKADEGVYYYVIEITNKASGEKVTKKGSVELLR